MNLVYDVNSKRRWNWRRRKRFSNVDADVIGRLFFTARTAWLLHLSMHAATSLRLRQVRHRHGCLGCALSGWDVVLGKPRGYCSEATDAK